MTVSASAAQLSDILGACGIVEKDDLSEAAEVSEFLAKPLPEVLIACGYIDANLANAALELTALMKEQLIERNDAIKCLPKVVSSGQSVKDVLRSLGWKPAGDVPSIRLGELLLDAHLITKQDFDQALADSRLSETPVGQNLIKAGKIDSFSLLAALDVLIYIRDFQLPRQEALKALVQSKQKKMPPEALLGRHLTKSRPVKIGELLSLAGIVPSDAILGAIELALFERKKVGQILQEQGLLREEVLTGALQIQELLDDAQLTIADATKVLRHLDENGCTMQQALAQLGLLPPLPDLRLGVLLKQAGLLTEQQIEETLHLSTRNQILFGRLLLLCEFVSKPVLYAALECQVLVRENILKPDHGIIALNYCGRMHCDLPEALKELGYAKTPLRGL